MGPEKVESTIPSRYEKQNVKEIVNVILIAKKYV
jgi:hypothetical protein